MGKFLFEREAVFKVPFQFCGRDEPQGGVDDLCMRVLGNDDLHVCCIESHLASNELIFAVLPRHIRFHVINDAVERN